MNVERTEEQLVKLENSIIIYVTYSLIDRATKKMRGVTINLENNILVLDMFFDSELTEEEEEEMQLAHTDVVAAFFKEFDNMELNLIVIPKEISIYDKKGNMDWIYLRREYD